MISFISHLEFPLHFAAWSLAAISAVTAAAFWLRFRQHLALVAKASHELRGPLCTVALGLDLLAETDPARRKRAAAMELELKRASRALDDLTAAREGQRARDEIVTCDVGVLLEQVVTSVQPLAERLGRRLRYCRPTVSVCVEVDPIRLAQAYGNLLLNAFEHGQGEVGVDVVVTAGRLRVEISDQGPGLKASLAELVAAGRASRARRGHGLAVAAQVGACFGGRLVSQPTDHTRLAIELPLACADPFQQKVVA